MRRCVRESGTPAAKSHQLCFQFRAAREAALRAAAAPAAAQLPIKYGCCGISLLCSCRRTLSSLRRVHSRAGPSVGTGAGAGAGLSRLVFRRRRGGAPGPAFGARQTLSGRLRAPPMRLGCRSRLCHCRLCRCHCRLCRCRCRLCHCRLCRISCCRATGAALSGGGSCGRRLCRAVLLLTRLRCLRCSDGGTAGMQPAGARSSSWHATLLLPRLKLLICGGIRSMAAATAPRADSSRRGFLLHVLLLLLAGRGCRSGAASGAAAAGRGARGRTSCWRLFCWRSSRRLVSAAPRRSTRRRCRP
jgi:hypothetical protein